jgi:hypothetical protein
LVLAQLLLPVLLMMMMMMLSWAQWRVVLQAMMRHMSFLLPCQVRGGSAIA